MPNFAPLKDTLLPKFSTHNMISKKYTFLLPFLFALIFVMGLQFGYKYNDLSEDRPSLFQPVAENKIEEVLNYIDAKYVDTVNESGIMNNAVDHLLEGLDPHSFYIRERDLEAVNENLEGKFEGIGVEFYIVRDTIIVVTPISGGPSEELGIMAGDKIVKIEDTVVAGKPFTNQDVINKLRGEKGTIVNVSIKRSGISELIDYAIVRDKIPIFSVDVGYMIDVKTGYIKINRFSRNTFEEFNEKLTILINKGMRNLVLDLRQNPGGYLQAATEIADELLEPRRMVVYTEGQAYQKQEYMTRRMGLFQKGEIAVLVDQGSASASEILAGAVQDWDRGLIIGRRSFGKGLVQEQYDLQHKGALRLTVARYYTPSGRCIQRSYEEGTEAYYEELQERFVNGELINSDSVNLVDTSAYYTSIGRKVYGGGGIFPDIFIPIDTTVNWDYMARIRRFIPQFVYTYFSDHRENFEVYSSFRDFNDGFQVDMELFGRFVDFAEQEGLKRDEDAIAHLESDIRVIMKAYIGKQIWKNEGYYPVINQIDKVVLRAAEELQQPIQENLRIAANE